jgi:dihydroneopterin aldolase
MTTQIYIRDLVVEAKHGVHLHEKREYQRFNVNLELTIDLRQAIKSDSLADTLDWSEIRDSVVSVFKTNSFNLIERLAQEIANDLLKDKRVRKLTLTIDKLDAFPSGVPGIRLEASN